MATQSSKIDLNNTSIIFSGTFLDGDTFIFNFGKMSIEQLPPFPSQDSKRVNQNFSGNGFVYLTETRDENITANWSPVLNRGINLQGFDELNEIWNKQNNIGFQKSSLTVTSAEGLVVVSYNCVTLNNNSFYSIGAQDGTTTTGNTVEVVFNLANSTK